MVKKGEGVELAEAVLKSVSSSSKTDQDGGVRVVTKLVLEYEGQDGETTELIGMLRKGVVKVKVGSKQMEL